MDGKGCWRDNVFVERLWRTIKYEEVYLRAYDSVSAAKASLARYIAFYNERRPHRHLDGLTPDYVYINQPPLAKAAQSPGLHLRIPKSCPKDRGHLFSSMSDPAWMIDHLKRLTPKQFLTPPS